MRKITLKANSKNGLNGKGLTGRRQYPLRHVFNKLLKKEYLGLMLAVLTPSKMMPM